AADCPIQHASRCPPLKEIVRHKEAAGPALETFLKHKKPAYRSAALQALAAIGYKASGVKVLALLAAPEPEVRYAAISSTGRLAPPGAVVALSRLLGSTDLRDKLQATAAIGTTRDTAGVAPLLRMLEDGHPKVQATAARSLGAIGDPRATMSLATMLADPLTRYPVRLAIAVALGRIGDTAAVPMLLQITGDPEVRVRKAAVKSLGQLGDVRAVAALSLLIDDAELTEPAIGAFARLGLVEGLPTLLRITKATSLSPELMARAFAALGKIESDETVNGLKPYLRSDDPQIVIWTCEALGHLNRRSALVSLIDTLHHDNKDAREMAAWAAQKLTGMELGTDIEAWEKWFYAQEKAKDPAARP
ncbi:MAG: HEAT repeat domain-containing protein, partial [Myxococcota bacterium]|nr:HEAT repeat domain-containing protein [Myxococcota bacterium]